MLVIDALDRGSIRHEGRFEIERRYRAGSKLEVVRPLEDVLALGEVGLSEGLARARRAKHGETERPRRTFLRKEGLRPRG